MVSRLLQLVRDEEGPTAVEYALMLAGIAAAVLATVFTLGTSVSGEFSDYNSDFTSGH